MSWVSAAVATVGLGFQGYQAYTQNKKAKELAKMKRPDTGEYQRGALESAKYQAGMTELPGQNLMQQKLDEGSAGAISNLKDVSSNSAGLGSNIANIYRGNVQGQNALGIAAANNWNANQGNLQNQLMATGQTEDARRLAPYYDAKGAEAALREASARNVGSMFKTAYNVSSDASKYQYQKNQGKDPYGDTGSGQTMKSGSDWNATYGGTNNQSTQLDPATISTIQKLVKENPSLFA